MIKSFISYRSFYLGMAIFFLSVKGFNDAYGEVLLPAFINSLKTAATAASLGLIFLYTFTGVLKKRISSPGIMASIFFVILTWYNFRGSFYSDEPSNYLYAFILFAFLLAGFCLDRKSLAKNLSEALLIYSSLYIALSSLIYLFGYGYTEGSSRFNGLAHHQNANGMFLVISLFTMIFYLNKFTGSCRILTFLAIIMAILLILVTGSRAAILVSFFGLLLLPRKSIPATLMALASGAILVSIYFMSNDTAISLSVNRMLYAPMDNRNEAWSVLWESFLRQPVVGEGDFAGVSGNIYLSAFAGTGLVGGAIFLLLSLSALFKAFSIIRKSQKNNFFDAKDLASSIILAVLVAGIFEAYTFDRLSPFPYIFCLSLIIIEFCESSKNRVQSA
ncbi:MAG: hypothetical protein V7751_09820 [Pseudoalteromonas distincta]